MRSRGQFTYNRRIAQESFRQVKTCIEAAGRLGMCAVAVHANRRSFLAARDWRDHRALGTGVIDLPVLFAVLREIDYDGLLQLELEEPDQEAALVASKQRLEGLISLAK